MNTIVRKNLTFIKFLKTRSLYTSKQVMNKKEVNITFLKANGDKINTKGKTGQTLLEVIVANNLDIEGYGACEGTLICSTCHLIFKKEHYDSLPNKPTEEELDMLDLAAEVTDTSRCGCQITLSEALDGVEIHVPATVNDQRL